MYIPIEYLASRGIRQEDADKFESSFFSDIYRQALDAIAMVIRTNKNRKKDKDNDRLSSDKHELTFYDVQNIVAFTGRRGTGKTSAMISVYNCLLNPEKIAGGFCDERTKNEIETVDFYPLPRIIDASHLGENEDLLEVVIAYMLKELIEVSEDSKFNEHDYGQEAEKLKKDLTKIQNDYDSLIQTEGTTIPVSYKMLVQGADKHQIQSILRDIIDRYLTVMLNCRRQDSRNAKKETKYLLVCIDDIDMYPGDPMQIMQCLYRYFTLPNVLVLTSWNYNMLQLYIYKHYFNRTQVRMAYPLTITDHTESERDRIVREQSNDYLRKIIPFDMRIVMPSWKKSDYKDVAGKRIRIYSKDNISQLRKVFPALYPGRLYNNLYHMAQKDELHIEVKSFIFQLLADRTGIYLDASGYKQHFMEPDGLRSTFELFDSLYLMQNIRERSAEESNKNKYLITSNHDKIRQNYKAILDTFYFKILPGLNLNDAESEFFNYLYKEKLSRRGKIIIDEYYVLRRRLREQDFPLMDYPPFYGDDEESKETKTKRDYSIGELFRIIHHSTRENVFSKELIKAILASYSFVMPYYFDSGMFDYFYRLDKAIEEKNTSSKDRLDPDNYFNIDLFDNDKIRTLFYIVGGSLLGNWAYELFGKKRVRCRFSVEKLVYNDDSKKNTPAGNLMNSPLGKLLSILMFVRIDRLQENETLNFIPIAPNEDAKKTKYELDIDLDPTAFLINVMRANEFFELIKKIAKKNGSSDKKDDVCTKLDEIDSISRGIILHLSRSEKNQDEHVIIDYSKHPLLPFPIHQTDLSYNVIKRSIKDIIYISDSELTVKSTGSQEEETNFVCDILERFYNNISVHLEEAKKEYPVFETPSENDDKNLFNTRFVEAGKIIGIWDNNDGDSKIRLRMTDYCSFIAMPLSDEQSSDSANTAATAGNGASVPIPLSQLIMEF